MKIVVYGIGGVGGYFGGKLAQTDHHTTFIARGKHLETIKTNGLHVKSIDGDFVAQPAVATDNVLEVEHPDLILLAVKSWQLAAVAQHIKPVIMPKTMVLPLQNGAENTDTLLKILHKENVLVGLCRIFSFIAAPGEIYHKAAKPQVLFGEPDNRKTSRIQALKAIFDAAGFDNRIPEDIHLEVWRKFLFIATVSGIGALTRIPIGETRFDPYIRNLMLQTAEEIKAVANAKGISLTAADIETTFAFTDRQAPESTASMQRDIMEGKPSELESFNGYIVREGRKHGIPTPVNEYIYRCLLPMENKARAYTK
ncbi:MAG: 2-dehydropantoate 2-reductase [Bacteroidota bacterium]